MDLDAALGKSALRVVERLQQHGFQAVIVGGAVRDSMMGRQPKDYDVATSAPPEEVCKLFNRRQQVGIAFGVVLVRDFGVSTEVATFRVDGEYQDGRRPTSVVFSDAEHDASRRDFTVNGLFYDPIRQEVHDYVGGIADIQAGIVRAIGDPLQRFSEDHLRMMRAIRFSIYLDCPIEEKTWAAICSLKAHIIEIVFDRIHQELSQIFSMSKGSKALRLLLSSGLLHELFAEMNLPPDLGGKLQDQVPGGGLESAMAWLLHGRIAPHQVEEFLFRYRLTNKEIRQTQCLLKWLRMLPTWTQHALCDQIRSFRGVELQQCQWLLQQLSLPVEQVEAVSTCLQAMCPDIIQPIPLLSGRDLIQAGIRSGPEMGKVIKALEDAQLNGELKNSDEAMEWLTKYRN